MPFVVKSLYIRTQLALWFTVIMAAVLAALSVAVYQLTRDSLLREVQQDVRQRAALIAAAAPTPLQASDTDVFSAPDVFVQILDPSGQVLGSSSNLGGRNLPFLRSAIRAAQVSEVRVGARPLFMYGRPVMSHGTLQGYVLVARSPVTIYQALGRLRSFLYPGAALALVLAGLCSWLLVRHSIRPLERVATSAAHIAVTQDHTRRLGYRGPDDEIGRLAATIDGMLASLERAHHELERAHNAQRLFLADISHELRTPLTIMLSSLDLLGRPGASDPEFQTKALADMRVEATRMARMVTQLLIMARSNAGAAIAHQPVLIVDTLTDACRQLSPDSNVTLRCHGLEALDEAVVQGDPDYLRQLFLILLDNAFKYTPSGGCVDVSGSVRDEAVAITVIDTGIGIEASDLPHIFDRFYRAGNVRSREGMGLGLAIARHIASQHNGMIDVTSEPGHGSRFTVTLPLAVGEPSAERQSPF